MNHVGFGEDRAAARHVGRFAALKAEANEILQGGVDPVQGGFLPFIEERGQPFRLLVDKGARSGSARTVGVEILQLPAPVEALDLKEGGVLSSHADDGSGLRLDEKDAQDLADRLELVEGAECVAQFFPVVAGKGDGANILLSEVPVQSLEEKERFLLNLSEVTPVGRFMNNSPVAVEQDTIKAYGTDVYADVIIPCDF